MSPLLALLNERAAACDGRVALGSPDGLSLDSRSLRSQVERRREALARAGVRPGLRVAVSLPNGPEAALAVLAAATTGTCLPLDPGLRADELRFRLLDARAVAIVVPEGAGSVGRDVAGELGLAVIEAAHDACATSEPWCVERLATADVVALDPGIALVLHTSGTTGRPKLVALSHGNVLAGARVTAEHLALGPSDLGLSAMPLFHTHGLVGSVMASLWAGSTVVCTPGFDARRWVDWIDAFRPTWYTASPTIHQAFVEIGDSYRRIADRHRFRVVRSTSSPLPPATLAALEALTGAPVVEAYALTEAPGQVAASPLFASPGAPRPPGAVGRPTGATIAIVAPDGTDLAPGVPGEIVVRGPGVIDGYEQDARIVPFADGRLHTGDLGALGEDGALTVLGRIKELVDRGGEKISPREIDECVLEHPGVREAASFGVPHPRLGEDLVVAVVPRAGTVLEPAALKAFLAARLSDAKRPSRVLVVPSIPKGPTGKVRRVELATEFASLLESPHVAPRDATEKRLAELWCAALRVDRVGVEDDFFALGGDSLNAVSLIVAIEQAFGRQLRLATLFECPTIAELARIVDGRSALRPTTVVPVNPHGSRPPLFFMSGWGNQLMVFNPIARELGGSRPLYALDPTALSFADAEAPTVESIASRMIEDIRRVQPAGPYHVAGFSLGGKFAWEIARQLRAAGHEVAMLALLDCEAPGFTARVPLPVRLARHARYMAGVGPRRSLRHVMSGVRRRLSPASKPRLFEDDALQQSTLARAIEATSLKLRAASAAYEPPHYDGTVMLIRATEREPQPGADARDLTLGWGALAVGGVTIRQLTSTHTGMLDALHAPALARLLAEGMAIAESPTVAGVAEMAARVGQFFA